MSSNDRSYADSTPETHTPIETTPESNSVPALSQEPSATTPKPPKKGRSPPPQGVQIPPLPLYQRQASGSRPKSPSAAPGQDASAFDLNMLPGPLSPGSGYGGQSFVFPIRSVFQGLNTSDSQQSMSPQPGRDGGALGRVASRTHGPPSGRYSGSGSSTPGEQSDDDDGFQSIAQMLAQGVSKPKNPSPNNIAEKSQPGSATFTGKTDRSGSISFTSQPPAVAEAEQRTPSPAFFPAPIMQNEFRDSPFFSADGQRRASDGVDLNPEIPLRPTLSSQGGSSNIVTREPFRPEVAHEDSSGTVRIASPAPDEHMVTASFENKEDVATPAQNYSSREKNPITSKGHTASLPKNDSTEADGSGLPDKTRAPVGVPQDKPEGINFRHYPGPDKYGKRNQFSTAHDRRATTGPETEERQGIALVPSNVKADPPSQEEQPAFQKPPLREPKPRHGSMQGLRNPSFSSVRGSSRLEGQTEGDELPEIFNDFTGIIRLPEAGSLSSIGQGSGGGTRTRSAAGSVPSTASGPTGARLAVQARQSKAVNMRDTVRNFVNEQAHTVNLSDPNAPAPSPGPGADADTEPSEKSTASDEIPYAERNATAGSMSEEDAVEPVATNSVEESSEAATVSGEDQGATEIEDEEEPIVTFRFEHVSTNDGHHVVVGREGRLQRCEDEPITTPGAVQGYGVLIVLDEDYETGNLSVRQVSENATELIGLSPRYLFRLDCFTRILTADQEDILRDNIEYLPDATGGRASVEEEGPQVFLLSGYGEPGSDDTEEDEAASTDGGRRREWTCWVAAHRPKQPQYEDDREVPNLIVLEFELERDVYNPLMQTFEAANYGTDTPDSASATTVSAGSRPDANMDAASAGSATTMGSTPHPVEARQYSHSSSASTQQGSGHTTRPSLKQRSSQPQGLEGLDVEMPLDRIIESTTNHAKPLRALERMRRTGSGAAGSSTDSNSGSRGGRSSRARRPQRRTPTGSTGTMDVFAVLGQINDQLGGAADLETFLKITVGVVQDLCRFHRVLIYQFDETFNGQVVAELVEWGKTTDLFKGLMFPAADIPAQARELYKVNKVRLMYDRSQTTARMVLRSKEDLDHPLDMTHCYLRAMSPIHIKYLANMHVRSSMSVSIMAFGQLWGLIACHSYGHHGMRVSFPVRQMMRILSDAISRNIERLSYAQRLHTRKLISTIPTTAHPTGYIVSNADDLLQVFDADAGLLVIGDGCKLLGQSEQSTAMLAIAEFLRTVKFDNTKASHHISKDFPDLVLPRAQDTIAGLLYVPLTAKAGQDFIVFLRKGHAREVQWAGKPYKTEQSGDYASLEPRKSFKIWSETVTGRSRAWTDDQLESAGVLALIYGKFIQVWREKQSAMASNQLTAILLSNTSHAVRTPLSQIINTLELALSGDIAADTRTMLENSHQASRALLFHVHDLLDLTRIETGNETAFNDPFDIRQSIKDAVRLYQTESSRRGLEFRLNLQPNLPAFVIGDSRKIKTVISNLAANSVKYTEKGFVEVYCGLQNMENSQDLQKTGFVPIEIIISDSGCGIPNDKLEAMFVTLEGADELRSESTGLGLGLAVVARIVEQLNGQLRAESEIDVGSRFFFTVPMMVDDGTPGATQSSKGSLIERQRTGSADSGSATSVRSLRSNPHHEIQTFVQDFGVSHMLPAVGPDDQRLRAAEARMNKPGTFPVTDSSYPVRPNKMDGDTDQETGGEGTGVTGGTHGSPVTPSRKPGSPRSPRPSGHARRISYFTQQPSPGMAKTASSVMDASSIGSSPPRKDSLRSKRGQNGRQVLRVLVVEDDAINSQILSKRLRMDKHTVIVAANGQEAVDALTNDQDIDVILMDIQMPIMDGLTAASEIRKLENSRSTPLGLDPLKIDGRIPIFAVSASLYESDRIGLSEHFDGWLLKPLDFSRVRVLLAALEDPGKRTQEVYVQGHWERGGYLKDGPR